MKNKDKIISTRVTTEVADILDIICEREGISKNKLVSDLITKKFSRDKNMQTLSSLQIILLKLKDIVDSEHHTYTKSEGENHFVSKVTTPCIIDADEEDGDYFGKLQILVGDDTCIREQDNKFYVYDFHDANAEPLLLTEQQILDYYEGKNLAYEFPMIESHSHSFIRGFVSVAKNLLNSLERKLNKYEKKD